MEFKIIGKTLHETLVIANVFSLYDTSGLPLTIIFDILIANDIMPSWIDFYKEARLAGWKNRTIYSRLSEALVDSYGPDFRDIVIERLQRIFKDI